METVPAKHLLQKTRSPAWFGTEYNLNLYRGCCHGCIYCDSRSECYRIDDFDRVRAKENAIPLLRQELAAKRQTGVVSLGAMSDSYNPFEEGQRLTRQALGLFLRHGFGAAIATKSDLITRDRALLAELSAQAPVIVKFSLSTADEGLAARVEPRAPSPARRLRALEQLSAAGVFAGVLLMPVLPLLEDDPDQVVELVRRAADAGARFVYPAFGVTLRQNQRAHYYRQLDRHFPGLAERYRDLYGDAYWCASPRHRELYGVFSVACQRRGLLYTMEEIVRAYKPPRAEQLSLF